MTRLIIENEDPENPYDDSVIQRLFLAMSDKEYREMLAMQMSSDTHFDPSLEKMFYFVILKVVCSCVMYEYPMDV